MTFKCEKCEKVFDTKFNYNRHMQRKFKCITIKKDTYIINTQDIHNPTQDRHSPTQTDTTQTLAHPIDPPNKYECKYCQKILSCNDSLRRHTNKFCNKYKEHIQKNTQNDIINNPVIANILKEMEQLKEENKELKNKYCPVNNNNAIENNIINGDNNTLINNNSHIPLVAFGKEDYKVITNKECSDFLSRGISSVTEVTKHIHFNKELPQYHNCYISNLCHNLGKSYDGDMWRTVQFDKIIDDLIEKSSEYLEDQYVELQKKLPEKAKRQFNKYLTAKKDDKKGLRERYEHEMKMILYDYHDIVVNTKAIKATDQKI